MADSLDEAIEAVETYCDEEMIAYVEKKVANSKEKKQN